MSKRSKKSNLSQGAIDRIRTSQARKKQRQQDRRMEKEEQEKLEESREVERRNRAAENVKRLQGAIITAYSPYPSAKQMPTDNPDPIPSCGLVPTETNGWDLIFANGIDETSSHSDAGCALLDFYYSFPIFGVVESTSAGDKLIAEANVKLFKRWQSGELYGEDLDLYLDEIADDESRKAIMTSLSPQKNSIDLAY